ncbi:MAG TPA: Fe(3+) ABC transporter substrate-binding protein [Candidatus Binatia bacterium]|nr:Fe(3+) ABC transporter substrate-binding protein [Candidatus Binatia bacterium]
MPKSLTRRRFLSSVPLAAAGVGIGAPYIYIKRASADAGEVNVYSARHYPSDQTLFDMFAKETGIKVNAIQGVAEELMQRQQMEGDSSPADVLITVDAGNLWRAQQANLLQPIQSDVLEKEIPANLRDPGGLWFSFSTRARVILRDTKKVQGADIATYEDLADPKWKGKLLITTSNSIYNQSLLASIIATDGPEKAEAWAKGLVANLARKPEGADTEQVLALAAGVGEIAVSNSYYYGRLLGSGADTRAKLADIAIVFPNQSGDGAAGRGAHINVSGGGVAAYAPNKANAVKFLEFLISPEAQKVFADANFEFPVRAGVAPHEIVKAWGPFKADALNVSALGKNNAEAVRIMDRAGWR